MLVAEVVQCKNKVVLYIIILEHPDCYMLLKHLRRQAFYPGKWKIFNSKRRLLTLRELKLKTRNLRDFEQIDRMDLFLFKMKTLNTFNV